MEINSLLIKRGANISIKSVLGSRISFASAVLVGLLVLVGSVYGATDITFTNPTAGDYVKEILSISWDYTGTPQSSVILKWSDDGSTWNPLTKLPKGSTGYNWDTTTVNDGSNYQLYIYEETTLAEDLSGIFTIDNTKPISYASVANYQNSLTFEVSFTVTDANPDYVELWYRYDDGSGWTSWTKYGESTISPISFTASGDGTFEFYTIAVDEAGNVEDSKTVADSDGSTIVDTQKPTTTDDAPIGWQTSSFTVTLTFSDPVPSSGEDWTKYCVDIDNSCIPNIDGKSIPFSTDGEYYLRYHSKDNAGNVQNIQDVFVQLDTQSPTVGVTAPPGDLLVGTDFQVDVTCQDGTSGCNTGTFATKTYTSDPDNCPTKYNQYDKPSSIIISTHTWVCGAAKDIAENPGFTPTPVEYKIFPTIQGAIDAASSGDLIKVEPTYDSAGETFPITVYKDVTIESSDPNNKAIVYDNTESTNAFIVSASGVTIKDLVIDTQAVTTHPFGIGIAVVDDADNVVISGNVLTTSLHGIWVEGEGSGITDQHSNNLQILNNSITVTGVATGIYVEQTSIPHSTWVVSGNIITATSGVNVELYDVSNVMVDENTFGQSGSVSFVYASENSDISGATITRNTFLGNGNVADITPTIWIESDFIFLNDDSSVSDVTISKNSFTDWINAAIMFGEDGCCSNVTGNIVVNWNNFFWDTTPDPILKSYIGTSIDATRNYWTTTDRNEISNLISGTGTVEFEPWLFTPHPDTIDPEIISMSLVGSYTNTNEFSPSNGQTMDIELTASEFVDYKSVRIIDSLGNQVRSLSIGGSTVFEISRTKTWDGKDESGIIVPDGEYTVKVNMEDLSENSNLDDVSDLGIIVVDNTPPSTTVEFSGTLGDNGWYISDVTVTLSCVDSLTACSQTFYSVDSGTFVFYSSPFIVSGNGIHTIEFYSVDSVNNKEITKSESVQIDTDLPSASIEINNNVTLTNTQDVTLTTTFDDPTSGVAKCRFSNDETSWSSWDSCNPSTLWTLTSGDEKKTVYYEVKDNAGNVRETSDTIFLDTTPPSITPPGDLKVLVDISINIIATITDANGVDSATLYYMPIGSLEFLKIPMDKDNFEPNEWNATIPPSSDHGVISYYIVATDNAGNTNRDPTDPADYHSIEVVDFVINFTPEWNLFSVPTFLDVDHAETALQDIAPSMILTYDSTQGGWIIPSSLEPLRGYYVRSTRQEIVEISFNWVINDSVPVIEPPSRDLSNDWNLIGVSPPQGWMSILAAQALDSVLDVALRIQNETGYPYYPSDFESLYLDVGEGYWLLMEEPGTIYGWPYS